MTTVTGDLSQAGLLTFYLVDQDGRRLHDAFVDGNTLVREFYVETDAAGVYSVDETDGLYPNSEIQANATATYWVRSFQFSQRRLLVPVSGTWDELQIAADPPPASPNPTATNRITSAYITSPVTGLSVAPFFFTAIAGTAVTVPDLAYSVELRGRAPVICPGTSGITFGLAIRETSSGAQVDIDYRPAPTAGAPVSGRPCGELAPHSSGQYQLYLTATASVTFTVDASPSQKAGIGVYAI